MAQLSLSLVENSESFLREALQKAVRAERIKSEWKFALFNLVQAIELALKEQLRREHPLLVFSDVDNPKLSVSIERALSRLSRVSSKHLSLDDIKNIQLAASIRNSITHHEVDVSVEQVKVIFASLLGFYADFCRRHLQVEISSSVPKVLWTKAISISAYANELYKRAEKRLKDENIDSQYLITCIKCWHDTFVDKRDICSCYLCGFSEPTTVCQECGAGLFESEAHRVYYGKWRSGDKEEPENWYPALCDSCHEDFLEHGIKPLREDET